MLLCLPDQLLIVKGLGWLSSKDVDLTLEDGQLYFSFHILLGFDYAVSHKITLWTVPETWGEEQHIDIYNKKCCWKEGLECRMKLRIIGFLNRVKLIQSCNSDQNMIMEKVISRELWCYNIPQQIHQTLTRGNLSHFFLPTFAPSDATKSYTLDQRKNAFKRKTNLLKLLVAQCLLRLLPTLFNTLITAAHSIPLQRQIYPFLISSSAILLEVPKVKRTQSLVKLLFVCLVLNCGS